MNDFGYAMAFCLLMFFGMICGLTYMGHTKEMKQLEIRQMIVSDSLEHLRASE